MNEKRIIKRLNILKVLVTSYNLMRTINDLRDIIGNHMTYDERENFAKLMHGAFNREVMPNEFIEDDDELSDEIINEYKKLRKFITRQNIIPEDKIYEFYDKAKNIDCMTLVLSEMFIDKVKLCAKHKLSFKALRNSIGLPHFSTSGITIIPNSQSFRALLHKIEKIYNSLT